MPVNANEQRTGQPSLEHGGTVAEPKARKACVNCRKQKMKCIPGKNDTCRRCHRAGLPCVFVPRANAAVLPDLQIEVSDWRFKQNVLRRLKDIENFLGIPSLETRDMSENCGSDDGGNGMESAEDDNLEPLWQATKILEECSPRHVPITIWEKSIVKSLWSSFHDRMPGLHFMQNKQTFSSPQPILLASMLYCCSMRGPPNFARHAPHYFVVLCNAIAQLSVPESAIGMPPEINGFAEEWAFQSVLGIVIAGLLNEAHVRETGIWISIAYRLVLEYCPTRPSNTSRDWQKLFSGLQIVDLEHASLHLSCPAIPIEPPLAALRESHCDQLYSLSRMMHTGLTHFTGRGLPTIWSCFANTPATTRVIHTFSAVDAAVIRDWARQLDDWLLEFSNSDLGSESSRRLVFRQYVLHRLVVLSIYHPARNCDLWSSSITPREQQELLLSARATLKLHLHDDSIWSNFDIVMITWAALIVSQGAQGNGGETDDHRIIRIHLEMLKQMNDPRSSFCDKLIARLEASLQGIHTPEQTGTSLGYHTATSAPEIDYSWQIFDQGSLQQVDSWI